MSLEKLLREQPSVKVMGDEQTVRGRTKAASGFFIACFSHSFLPQSHELPCERTGHYVQVVDWLSYERIDSVKSCSTSSVYVACDAIHIFVQ
jgi:hypothetical protein